MRISRVRDRGLAELESPSGEKESTGIGCFGLGGQHLCGISVLGRPLMEAKPRAPSDAALEVSGAFWEHAWTASCEGFHIFRGA